MKRLLIFLLAGLFAQLVVSCYPEGADNVEDYDVAMTNYDKGADFSTFTTYSMPDSIVYFSNDKNATIDHRYDSIILQTVQDNFTSLGYQEVETPDVNNMPSFVVMVSGFSNVNYSYFVDNWYNNWNWYWSGWWPGWGYDPYYPWYPVGVYSYQTGSIVVEMVSTTPRSDNKMNILWTGIADGLLQGSSKSIKYRITKEINQCFTQSPYLKK